MYPVFLGKLGPYPKFGSKMAWPTINDVTQIFHIFGPPCHFPIHATYQYYRRILYNFP